MSRPKDSYRWYNDGYGWVDCSEEDQILITEEMIMRIQPNQNAYVVSHRGYKAHVKLSRELELIWELKSQNYRSEFSLEEHKDEELRWIIQ